MSEKQLSAVEWKKFAKGRDLKDAGLLKAFTEFEKAKAPDEQLKALAAVEKESATLLKSAKGDKELSAYLEGIQKAVAKEEKLAKAAQTEAESEEEEGEADTPVLLTTKLVPLLKAVRNGEEMQALVGNAGKEVAVLMSRQAISPARRQLLVDYLADSGMPKFLPGTCVFEQSTYTFVLKGQGKGLAKKLKEGLRKQTGQWFKVQVRGEDGLDDDGGLAEGETSATSGSPDGTIDRDRATFEQVWPGLQKQVLELLRDGIGDVSKLRAVAEFVREKSAAGNFRPALQGIESLKKLIIAAGKAPAPPQPTPEVTADKSGQGTAKPQSEELKAFNERLNKLLPALKEAIAAGGERGQDLKLKASQASVAARKGDFGEARRFLEELEAGIEKLLADVGAKRGEQVGATRDEVQESPERGGQSGSGKDQIEFEKQLTDVEPGYLDLLSQRHPEASRLRSVLGYANEQAENGQFAKAIAALGQLKKLIDAARKQPGAGDGEAYPGLVAYRKSLLGLRQAVGTVERQIAQLVAAIPTQLPDEVDLAEELADSLRDSTEALYDLVDEAMGAADDPDTRSSRELRAMLEGLIAEVGSDPVIQHVDANPFGVALSISTTLGKALESVRATMPEPA